MDNDNIDNNNEDRASADYGEKEQPNWQHLLGGLLNAIMDSPRFKAFLKGNNEKEDTAPKANVAEPKDNVAGPQDKDGGASDLAEEQCGACGDSGGMLETLAAISLRLNGIEESLQRLKGREQAPCKGEELEKSASALEARLGLLDKLDKLDDIQSILESAQKEPDAGNGRFEDLLQSIQKLEKSLEGLSGIVTDLPEKLAKSVDSKFAALDKIISEQALKIDKSLADHFSKNRIDYNEIKVKTEDALDTRQTLMLADWDKFFQKMAGKVDEIKGALTKTEDALGTLKREMFTDWENCAQQMTGKAEEIKGALGKLERFWQADFPRLIDGADEGSLLSLVKKILDLTDNTDRGVNSVKTSLDASLPSLNEQLDGLDGQLGELKNKLWVKNQELEKEIGAKDGLYTSATAELSAMKVELNSAQSENEAIRKDNENLKQEKDGLGTHIQELKERLARMEELKRNLENSESGTRERLAASEEENTRMREKWKAWDERLKLYEPVREALLNSPFFVDFAHREGIGSGDEGLFNCMRRLGRSSDFLRALHEYASAKKIEQGKNAQAMQEDEIMVYDALNHCYRKLMSVEHDYFLQSGERGITEPFQRSRFNKTTDRHMKDPNDRGRTYVQKIYVPMLKNDSGGIMKPAEVEAGNE